MEKIKQILLCTLLFSVSLWSQNSQISIADLNLPESFEKSINLFTTRDSVLEFHKSVSQPLNSVVYLIKNAGIKTVISKSYHNQ
jgi:hypothetical protein